VIEPQVYLIAIAILLALDWLTVASRGSLLHANLTVLLDTDPLSEPRHQRVISLLESLPRLQASLILAQTVWRFLLLGSLLLLLSSQAVALLPLAIFGIILLAALVIFWLDWSIRSLVSSAPHRWALRLIPFANAIRILAWPFVTPILTLSGRTQDPLESDEALIQNQLRSLVDAGQQRGLIEQEEGRMIHSIFELSETLAREIMVPRIDMLTLDVQTPPEEAVDTLLTSHYSRMPVYQDSVDHILGLLYAKDLLRVWREGKQDTSLRTLLRPAYFVPEAKKINELLEEMQSQRVHMAIIVDEYGGVAGLVTLEDIVEEILGEIQDEYDQVEELPYQSLGNGEYLFQGRIGLDDFNEVMSSNLATDEADTLGGFIYNSIGRVPAVGDAVKIESLLLTVEQVSGRRIRKVRASWLPDTQQKEKITHADG
jgi:CBS domain containing-hemolysin-like protein